MTPPRHPRRPTGRPGPLLLLGAAALLAGAGCSSQRKEVLVFAAASLARALADLEETVESREPEMELRIELGGSLELCRRVAELHRPADVVLTADLHSIDDILRPDHASFTIQLATNEVVLAHLEHSRHTEEVTAASWPEVLLRPGVKLGLASSDLAPIGYRTLLVWQLAERATARRGLASALRQRVRPEHLVPDEGHLMQLLQTRTIDYVFIYRSTAEEHRLKLVELPAAYSLGRVEQQAAYRQASVEVATRGGARKRLQGEPVLYGATIPRAAPNPDGAVRFLGRLLGEEGQASLRRTGFSPLSPARCREAAALPPPLRALTR